MDGATQIAATVESELAELPTGSLSFFGDIFGGRIDNIHRVTGSSVEGESCLVLQFNGGETLRVWDPGDARISASAIRIGRASRVRWEWFYYGRPALPENLCILDYVWDDGRIYASRSGPGDTSASRATAERPAVEMLWWTREDLEAAKEATRGRKWLARMRRR